MTLGVLDHSGSKLGYRTTPADVLGLDTAPDALRGALDLAELVPGS
jgi:hypothetical protein